MILNSSGCGYRRCWRCGSKDIPQMDLPCAKCLKIIYAEHDRLVAARGGKPIYLPDCSPNDFSFRLASQNSFTSRSELESNRYNRRTKRRSNAHSLKRIRKNGRGAALANGSKNRKKTNNHKSPDFVAWWFENPRACGMSADVIS